MSEWKEARLGDICTIVGRIGFRGYTSKDLVDSPDKGAISLSPSNIANFELNLSKVTYISWEKYYESPEIMVALGDIVFSKTGTVGWSAYIKEVVHPITLNPQLVVFKDIKINPVYLSYVMRSHLFKGLVKNITGGSAVPTLSQKDLGNLRFPVADTITQNKIASTLSSLDDKIEINRRICENLEAQAQALFKHWFIDFAPFKNGKFVESELGMIPEGWKVGKFTDIFDLGSGGTPKTSEKLFWEDGSIPFFSPKDVNGVYCFDTEKHITEKGLNNCNSSLYSRNSVFITCRGTVGKVAMAAVPMAMNQSNYAILSNKGYSQYFAYLMTVSIVKKLKFKANGAVFDAITSKDFKEQIIIPNVNDVNRFDSIIQPIFDNILNLGFENLRLSTLRDTLLPKLMSGQIKV